MLLAGDGEVEEAKAERIIAGRGPALLALGISLDELAIGFRIGLAHMSDTAVIAAIALQAFIAAQLGLAVGAKVSKRLREVRNRSQALP